MLVARHQKNLAQPYFANFRCSLNKMKTKVISLTEKMKTSRVLLICCGRCSDLIWKKKQKNKKQKNKNKNRKQQQHFYFISSLGNQGPSRAKSLQNGGLSFLPSQRKFEPVTTHKMALHLMDVNTIFQENMCLTDPSQYKHSKNDDILTTL